jgi:hypothetical protein
MQRLNHVLSQLPAGFIADSTWLQAQGLSRSSIRDYATSGWLQRVAPRVYRRPLPHPGAPLRWDVVALSLQRIMGHPVHVGGATALELAGYAHYVSAAGPAVIHIYGGGVPAWLVRLSATARFDLHSTRLFGGSETGVEGRRYDLVSGRTEDATSDMEPDAPWDWPLRVASPERAIMEMIDELPKHETFHQVDMAMQGLTNLRPRLLGKLLQECKSLKVRRVFLWYADRHHHTWRKHLDTVALDLGKGKRQLVPGGRLDARYQITLPGEMFEDDGGDHAG